MMPFEFSWDGDAIVDMVKKQAVTLLRGKVEAKIREALGDEGFSQLAITIDDSADQPCIKISGPEGLKQKAEEAVRTMADS
jgi:hypothetical protein